MKPDCIRCHDSPTFPKLNQGYIEEENPAAAAPQGQFLKEVTIFLL
jgi:hypothetical protein